MDLYLQNLPRKSFKPLKEVGFQSIFASVPAFFCRTLSRVVPHMVFRKLSSYVSDRTAYPIPGKTFFSSGIVFFTHSALYYLKRVLFLACTIGSITTYAESTSDEIFIQAQNRHQAVSPPTVLTPPERNLPLSGNDLAMMRQVVISAFTFMTPRLLQPHNVQELSLWGLSAFVTRDPDLSITEITSAPLAEDKNAPPVPRTGPVHKLVALRGNKLLFEANFPSDSDYKGWAALVTSIIQKAWNEDTSLQNLGKDRLLPLFFSGIFSHIDPYSRYLPPEQARKERTHRQGLESSIGLTLKKQSGGYPVIETVNPSSMIWANGADIGQKVYEINGHNTAGVSLETISSWIDQTGTHNVTISYGPSLRKAKFASIQPEHLAPQTAFLERQKNGYLLLHIKDFSTQTADEISQLLSDALPADSSPHPRGIILDLRGNKGGVLQQAVMTAALFMDRGIVATTSGRYPAANHVWAVQGGDITNNSPLIILVDGQTASAAEVLAAALADHRRAVIIGSATYGKGLVQDIGQMPNGGEIFVTWSRNTAPLGEPLQKLGVIPQLCLSSHPPTTSEQVITLRQGQSLQNNLMKQSRLVHDDTALEDILKIRQKCPASQEATGAVATAYQILMSPLAYQTALKSIPLLADAAP